MAITPAGGVGAASLASDPASSGDIQYKFAMLQLSLCEKARNMADQTFKDIETSQEDQKKTGEFIKALDAQWARVDSENEKALRGTEGPRDQQYAGNTILRLSDVRVEGESLASYIERNKLFYEHCYESSDAERELDDGDVDRILAALEAYKERRADVQAQMVAAQDLVGQYNALLQGAGSALQRTNQVQEDLIRTLRW
jgi:hypothetical protein